MKIIVNPHEIEIHKEEEVNKNEYKINKCEFEFSEEYTNDLVKVALFTNSAGTYKQYIVNNECDIPAEILAKQELCVLGVYAYKEDNNELKLRYSPVTKKFYVTDGSYKENASNSEPITPTDKEQMEQAILDMETQIDNLDIDAEKVDKTTTITITKKDGTQEEVEILDGEDGTSLENIEIKNRDLYVTYGGSESDLGQVAPNIQIGTTTTGLPNSQANVVNVGTDLNPILNFTIPKGEAGSIKFEIVAELPETGQEDTIYLVPLETPDTSGNNYAEYIYINNAWELLGKIGVQVDLTDYVKNTDYATNSVGGVTKVQKDVYGIGIDGNGFLSPQLIEYPMYLTRSNYYCISKGTLENVITGKGLTTKSYVDGLVGDIATALDTIQGEVI